MERKEFTFLEQGDASSVLFAWGKIAREMVTFLLLENLRLFREIQIFYFFFFFENNKRGNNSYFSKINA